jgi:DNA-binding NtrC family response regulator
MPGIDGLEMTERIRAAAPDVPVIWITAHGCHRFESRAKALCVFRCLDKPLEISAIRRVAREALDVEADA